MTRIDIYKAKIGIGYYQMTHCRRVNDQSEAALLKITPVSNNMGMLWNLIDQLPLFITKAREKEIFLFINGIRDIDEKLARQWGLKSEYDSVEFKYNVAFEKFQAITFITASRLSSLLQLPILSTKFSKSFTSNPSEVPEVQKKLYFYDILTT